MRAIYKENDANFPRLKTDRLFVDFDAQYDWNGNTDDLIRFVERIQLKDVPLWRRVVKQFGFPSDSPDNGWRGEFFGKLLRGGSFVWLYTRDEDLYQILTDAVENLLTTQDDLGRISTYEVSKEFRGWDIWGRKYAMLGLEYYLEICQDEELAGRIVNSLCRQADYLVEKIGKGPGQIEITETSDIWGNINSCSILEPIVRLYNITKEQKYLDFARYIVETGGMKDGSLVELALDDKLYPYQYPVVKAYEMMSFFEGLLEFYRATGEEKYRKAVENFVYKVKESEITIIGSAGCWGENFNHSVVEQTNPAISLFSQETCVTVTWMKLCMQLLCLNGDPALADAMEISAYNALFGAVNTQRVTLNHGFPFDSYSPLLIGKRGRWTGGYKMMSDGNAYGCCTAIGACGMGMVPRIACMRNEAGVTLNIYNDGTIRTGLPSGNPVALTVSGGYPVGGKITITLGLEQDENFTLSLRIPGWSKKNSLTVNGETVAVTETGYLPLERLWKNGDTIVLTLDLRTRMMKQDLFVSYLRGPLVMARDGRLGEDILYPQSALVDEDGFVQTVPSFIADFPTQVEEKVVMTYDRFTTVVDYASAGKTWGYDSTMAAWLPFDTEV